MPFRLFREQRQQNIFCQGLFEIDWWFLCKMILSFFLQENVTWYCFSFNNVNIWYFFSHRNTVMSQMQCTQFRFSTKHNISLEPQCPPPKKNNSCMLRSMPMFLDCISRDFSTAIILKCSCITILVGRSTNWATKPHVGAVYLRGSIRHLSPAGLIWFISYIICDKNSFTGKKGPTKICLAPNMWLCSSVGRPPN